MPVCLHQLLAGRRVVASHRQMRNPGNACMHRLKLWSLSLCPGVTADQIQDVNKISGDRRRGRASELARGWKEGGGEIGIVVGVASRAMKGRPLHV